MILRTRSATFASRTCLLGLCSALLLSFSLTACSKSDTAASNSNSTGAASSTSAVAQKDILDQELASLLPSGTFGFFVFDVESETYKKYKASPWGQLSNGSYDAFIKAMQASPGEGAEVAGKVQPVLSALEKTGFLNSKPGQPEVYRQMLAFASFVPGSPIPSAGVYVSGAAGSNMSEKLAVVEASFKEQGLVTTVQDYSGIKGFSLSVPASAEVEESSGDEPESDEEESDSEESAKPKKAAAPKAATAGSPTIFFAANADKLAIGTQKEVFAALFNPAGFSDKGNYVKQLKASSEYQRTVASHGGLADKMLLGLVEVGKVVKNYAPLAGAAQANLKPEDMPIELIAISKGMQATPADKITVSVTARNELQKKWLSMLTTKSKGEMSALAPSDTLLLLGLSGELISSIVEISKSQAPNEAKAQIEEQAKMLNGLKNLGLLVRGPSGPMPMPDLALLASFSDGGVKPEAALETYKGLIGAMLSSQGAFSSWQEKEISGTKTSYFMSPFGVGIFLASIGGNVAIASSEKMIEDLVNVKSGKGTSLAKSLSAASQASLSGSAPLVLIYSNFARIATTMQTLQGSLAMFTGGQGGVDQATLDNLKKLGTILFSASYTENMFSVETHYESAGS